MHRSGLAHAAPLLLCAALGGCSSSAPAASSVATGATSAPPPAATTAPTAPTTSAPAEPPSSTGEITFTGALSGKMTMYACRDEGLAQLLVVIDGQDGTFNGLIDADDFTFVVPHSTGYTLAAGASKPKVVGTTYTVKNTKLVSTTNEDTVTANGSVTCP